MIWLVYQFGSLIRKAVRYQQGGGVADELQRKQDRDARRSRAGVRRSACLERNHGARVEDRGVDASVQKRETRRERVWV